MDICRGRKEVQTKKPLIVLRGRGVSMWIELNVSVIQLYPSTDTVTQSAATGDLELQ